MGGRRLRVPGVSQGPRYLGPTHPSESPDHQPAVVLVQARQYTTVAEAKYDTVCPHKTMAGPAGRTVDGACHGIEGYGVSWVDEDKDSY